MTTNPRVLVKVLYPHTSDDTIAIIADEMRFQRLAEWHDARVAAMREVLEDIARQHISDEMDDDTFENADVWLAYDTIIGNARAALAAEADDGGRADEPAQERAAEDDSEVEF